jgi:hypothetical protein
MASVRYGLLVVDLAGKVGGQNFQRGLASPILRNISPKRKFIVYPQIAQATSQHRSKFAYVTQYWKSLTTEEQTAWNTSTSSFPRVNKFGARYYPSGYQLFCELNFALLLANYSIVSATPITATFVAYTFTCVYETDPQHLMVTISSTPSSEVYRFIISACVYQPHGKGYAPSKLKIMNLVTFSEEALSVDILPELIATYGPVISGSTIWVAIKQIFVTTGEMNMYQQYIVEF